MVSHVWLWGVEVRPSRRFDSLRLRSIRGGGEGEKPPNPPAAKSFAHMLRPQIAAPPTHTTNTSGAGEASTTSVVLAARQQRLERGREPARPLAAGPLTAASSVDERDQGWSWESPTQSPHSDSDACPDLTNYYVVYNRYLLVITNVVSRTVSVLYLELRLIQSKYIVLYNGYIVSHI